MKNPIIEVKGNDIYQKSVKIGWISGNHIYDHAGKTLGYFTNTEVYDFSGKRIAKLSDHFVFIGEHQKDLDDITDDVTGVDLSKSCQVAIYCFFNS